MIFRSMRRMKQQCPQEYRFLNWFGKKEHVQRFMITTILMVISFPSHFLLLVFQLPKFITISWVSGQKKHCSWESKFNFKINNTYLISGEVPKLEPISNATPISFVSKPRCQFSSEILPGQHFLYKENQQTSCQVKVTKSREFIEGRTKLIDKAIRETALVNSTFASAILQLSQMNTSAESLNEHITIYNSLQECLSTSIASLEQIRGQLTGNNSSRWH